LPGSGLVVFIVAVAKLVEGVQTHPPTGAAQNYAAMQAVF
jgi:hypothetical protein